MKTYRSTLSRLATLTALLGASASAQVSYQYYRFEPTKLYANGTVIQLSEFVLSNGGTRLNLIANNPEITPARTVGQNGTATNLVPVTVTGGSRAITHEQGAPAIIDGATGTKWLTGLADLNGEGKYLYFSFAAPVTFDSYSFATGGDTSTYPNRNPIDWKVWGRNAPDGAWVLIDRVTNYPANPANQVFQQDFPITGDILPVINYFNCASGHYPIVRNGTAVDVEWDTYDTELSDYPDSMSMSPSIGSPPLESELRSITPPAGADTLYTLTATEGTRTSTKQLTLRSVAGGTASNRFYRFTPISTRPGADGHQLSEFSFFNNGVELNLLATNANPAQATGSTGTNDNLVNVVVTNPGGSQAANAPLLVDGKPATKLFDNGLRPVVFEFPQETTIDSYRFTTANDLEARDPVKWILEGSNDGTTWALIDNVTAFNYPTSTTRQVQSQVFPLPGTSLNTNVVSPTARTWAGTINTNYDEPSNWAGGLAPGMLDEIIVSDGTKEAIRGGNLDRTNKTTLSGTGKITVNGRFLNRSEFNMSGGTLKQTGNYFIVGVNSPGTFNQTAGTVEANHDRGFFIADDAPAAGSKYLLSGTGQLTVKSSGNGNTSLGGSVLHNVHIGKAAAGDLFQVSGGQASFTSSANNFFYISRTGTMRVTGGTTSVAGYTAFLVGFEGAGNNLLEISGGSMAITGITPLLVGGGSSGAVTLSGGSLSIDQAVSLAASNAAGSFTMSGGTLKAANITSGAQGSFTFNGGEITLTGDRRSITGETWFHGAAGTTASYDAGLNRTRISISSTTGGFAAWAAAAGIPADQQGAAQDPDGDGVPNLLEFALAGLPGNPGSQGIQAPVATSGSAVITLAVRAGANFSLQDGRLTAVVDGIRYQIQGSIALGDWDAAVEEVSPALTQGVSNPASAEWQLRSFRLTDAPASKGFLRVDVVEATP